MKLLRQIALVYGPFALLLAVVLIVGRTTPVRVDYLMRDPSAVFNGPFYVGMVSHVGVILWISCAAVCLLTASVLRNTSGRDEWFYMFRFAGYLTACLGLDDLFMFHEEIFPDYLFPEGRWYHMSEKIVFLGYLAAFFVFFKRYGRLLMRTDVTFLVLGFGFLGLAMVSDQGFVKHIIPSKPARAFLEDALKLLGVVGWCAYFVITAKAKLSEYTQNKASM